MSDTVPAEASLAPAGERHLAEVSWNDFVAALAMLADGKHATPEPASRLEPRRVRGREKKVALPRAYLAARQGARRNRTDPTPSLVTTSHESVTGVRNPPQRTALAPADRWLLVGLMLSASVLVAVLTSAFTVRDMQRAGAAAIAARHDTARHDTALAVAPAPPAVAPAPPAAAPAPMPVAPPARATDSVPVAATTRAVDSVPVRARATHPARTTRRQAVRADKRSLSIAERGRVVPRALAGPAPQLVTPPVTPPITQPITQPAPASPPAPTPATNAQFLEELRAIHAEIDARKAHMDSLTRSLDSLKKISPPS